MGLAEERMKYRDKLQENLTVELKHKYVNKYREIINKGLAEKARIKETYKDDVAESQIDKLIKSVKTDIQKLKDEYLKDLDHAISEKKAAVAIEATSREREQAEFEKLDVISKAYKLLQNLVKQTEKSNKISILKDRISYATEAELKDIIAENKDDSDILDLIEANIPIREAREIKEYKEATAGMEGAENIGGYLGMPGVRLSLSMARLEKNALENELRELEGYARVCSGYQVPFDPSLNPDIDLGAYDGIYFNNKDEKSNKSPYFGK